MAGKKLPKDVDFAAGFFSQPAVAEDDSATAVVEKITAPKTTTQEPKKKEETTDTKNLGGRPKKDGLKNEQFTLTMNPETYEKLRIVAEEQTRGNFSALIDEAIKAYCKAEKIDLSTIEVEPQILEMYRQKQAKKSKKK